MSLRTRRTSSTRRPSSAVGGSGNEVPNARRISTNDRGGGPPSRPGSATGSRVAFTSNPVLAAGPNGFAGNRQATPPTSARVSPVPCGQVSPDIGGIPNARPVTPMNRHGSIRAGPSPGNSNRASSAGPGTTSLPLHVSTVGRPRTPTGTQRRIPSNGVSGSAGGKDVNVNAHNTVDSAATTRMDSSCGNTNSTGGGLTTVISSALDYKRFLDRRKQMIQQQVENAQQANAARRSASGNRQEADNSQHAQATRRSETPVGYHNRQSLVPEASDDCVEQGGTHELTTTQQLVNGFHANGWSPGAPSCKAAQQFLQRANAGQQPPSRAQTPTRQTQANQGVQGLHETGDSSDIGRSSKISLPAGGGRQACRSLGQTENRNVCELLARGEYGNDTIGVSNAEGFVDVADVTTTLNSSTGIGAGMRMTKTRTESSTEGFQRSSVAGERHVVEATVDRRVERNERNDREREKDTLTGSSVEDYIIGKQIGQGAYATVCFGLHKESSRKVAIKIYEKYKLLDPQRRKSVRCEIRLMERLRHPNIVIFHEALDTSKQIYLVMDYIGGGSLHHFLKKRPGRRLEDQVAKRLFFQVCQGVRYLHDRHIVHRDVKLENLLLDEAGTVKIIDFGFSTIIHPGKKLKIFCGTPSYMSPEIVGRKEYSGFCADIWAMGVLLYALLCGSFPFRGQNDRDLYRKIVRGVFQIPEHVGNESRNLLNRVLTTDMDRRPTVDDVLADMWLHAHKDDLYTKDKSSAAGYQHNMSTSSTATTAAPSSSAGQSARDISAAENSPLHQSGSHNGTSGGVSRGAVGRFGSMTGASGTPLTGVNTANACLAATAATSNNGTGPSLSQNQNAAALAPVPVQAAVAAEEDSKNMRNHLEEEALCKLERLGYPRDEILRQLQDETSQLFKLYHRFLKALTAWDSKK